MRIRKLFRFENAHIVRNCSTDRCRRSLHGHSYQVELILEANRLDHGQMVYDFGLLKGAIKDVIDSFDHSVCFWDQDDPDYISACKRFSARWVQLPVSPSAEQFSRILFYWAQQILAATEQKNGESGVSVYSVIAHETTTGYAQCFQEDVDNPHMGVLCRDTFKFSDQVRAEWSVPDLLERLADGRGFGAPEPLHQVPVQAPHK